MNRTILPLITLLSVSCSNLHTTKAVNKDKLEYINIETEGNLKPTNPISCIPISEVKNNYTPADLFTGVIECLKKDEFEYASNLQVFAFLYGYFDINRVADNTAGQGLEVMRLQTLKTITSEQVEKYQAHLENAENKKRTLISVCNQAKKIGHPQYHPSYMILHGINAFTGIEGNGLKEKFDSNATWNKLLLACNE